MQDIDPKLLIIFEKIGLENKSIDEKGNIGKQFAQQNIHDLYAAINYIHNLKYQPPSEPFNWNLVIPEQRGTCSTRHALLVVLAQENHIPFTLGQAIYNLTPEKFPIIRSLLEKYKLPFILESHNFIIFKDYFLDSTFPGNAALLCKHDVESVKPIDCGELLHEKTVLYPQFLKQWLKQYGNMTLDEYAVFHREVIDLLGGQ